jgi:hypothetical protein
MSDSFADGHETPEDPAGPDPPVDSAAVVPNLKAITIDRLHEMQVFISANAAQDDVPDAQRRRIDGDDGAELSRSDSRRHRVPARTEGDAFSTCQPIDVRRCPSHKSDLRKCVASSTTSAPANSTSSA